MKVLYTICIRCLLFLFLLVAVCVFAGLYGVLHNQISYTVSPEYFHAFKFRQFFIPEIYHNRLGASIVGWHASWWMGALAGIPVLTVCLPARTHGMFVKACIRATAGVTGTSFLIAMSALVVSFLVISADSLPSRTFPAQVTDLLAFTHAGTMHNASYSGATAGLLVGLALSIYTVIASWRKTGAK